MRRTWRVVASRLRGRTSSSFRPVPTCYISSLLVLITLPSLPFSYLRTCCLVDTTLSHTFSRLPATYLRFLLCHHLRFHPLCAPCLTSYGWNCPAVRPPGCCIVLYSVLAFSHSCHSLSSEHKEYVVIMCHKYKRVTQLKYKYAGFMETIVQLENGLYRGWTSRSPARWHNSGGVALTATRCDETRTRVTRRVRG